MRLLSPLGGIYTLSREATLSNWFASLLKRVLTKKKEFAPRRKSGDIVIPLSIRPDVGL